MLSVARFYHIFRTTVAVKRPPAAPLFSNNLSQVFCIYSGLYHIVSNHSSQLPFFSHPRESPKSFKHSITVHVCISLSIVFLPLFSQFLFLMNLVSSPCILISVPRAQENSRCNRTRVSLSRRFSWSSLSGTPYVFQSHCLDRYVGKGLLNVFW
jgi:hypothetical protein